MIENLSFYWDKADGKIKQKILGCIFTEKFENFDFESCNNIFTPEIKSNYEGGVSMISWLLICG